MYKIGSGWGEREQLYTHTHTHTNNHTNHTFAQTPPLTHINSLLKGLAARSLSSSQTADSFPKRSRCVRVTARAWGRKQVRLPFPSYRTRGVVLQTVSFTLSVWRMCVCPCTSVFVPSERGAGLFRAGRAGPTGVVRTFVPSFSQAASPHHRCCPFKAKQAAFPRWEYLVLAVFFPRRTLHLGIRSERGRERSFVCLGTEEGVRTQSYSEVFILP